MRSATRAVEEARLQLEEAESGRFTPPAPSLIPMAQYYEQAELDYAEAMKHRHELEETCSRLEAITAEQLSKSQRDRLERQQEQQAKRKKGSTAHQGGGDEESSNFTLERRAQSNVTRKASGVLSPRKSVMLISPRSMRKPSQSPGANTSSFFAGDPLGASFVAPGPVSTVMGGAADGGGESLSDALIKLDRIKAVLASTKIAPVVNPYKNRDAAEAEKRRLLRPHSVALLEPLPFESAALPTEFDRSLREAQEVLRVEHEKNAAAERDRQESQSLATNAYRDGITEWRGLESAQLELVYRHAMDRVYSESEYWSTQNHREKSILDKVNDIHVKAKAQEAAKLRERETLSQLSKISEARVAIECFVQQEDCYRKAIMAAERTIFDESIRIPLTLAVASVELEKRHVIGAA